MNITVYSTGCPQCKVLMKKLEDKNINYCLIEDIDKVSAKAQELNISFVPFMEVDNKIYNFIEAIDFIKNISEEN